MSRTFKYYFLKIKRIFIKSENTPESMARGIALGIFVGLTPSVGFQMLPAVLLAIIFRGNKILALIFTYVSNPVTVLPIYGLAFYLGSLLWPDFKGSHFFEIKDVVLNFSFEKMTQVGIESVIVLWTGGLIMAIPAGILSYFIFYRIILFYRRQKELRRELRKKMRPKVSTITKIKSKLKFPIPESHSQQSDKSVEAEEKTDSPIIVHEDK